MVWNGTWLPCSIFAGLLSRVIIFGADTVLLKPSDSPADSRRSNVPVVPKNLPMVSPMALVGTAAAAVAGRFTSQVCSPGAVALPNVAPDPAGNVPSVVPTVDLPPWDSTGVMSQLTPRPLAKPRLAWTILASI